MTTNSLQQIEQNLVAAAQAEWARIKAEGVVIAQELKTDAESMLVTLSQQFGPLIMQTISGLATAEFASLSGSEKHNLATTTVVDKAAQAGIAILAEDATALVKNGFEAFASAAPNLVPAELAGVAQTALAAGEAAVEGAVNTAAGDVAAKVEPPPG